MRSQESKMLNKINLDMEPSLYPNNDRGNLRLFYELELLKSHYENTECPKCLEKYLETIDTLVQRGHQADFSTGMKIDKAVRIVKLI